MFHWKMRFTIIFAIILTIILLGLNIKKFASPVEVVPVWSSYDEEYYGERDQDNSLLDRVKLFFSADNILYRLTRIRVRAPITYLKREIPLLAYYTPIELREEKETIYEPTQTKNRIIKLQFDLGQEILKKPTRPAEEIKPQKPEPKPEPEKPPVEPRGEQPLIFIYHTHTSETYIDDPRPQDNNGHVRPGNIGNIAKVGMELAKTLTERYNCKVVHNTTVHDQSYARSYYNSRQTVQSFIKQHDKIDLILDLHRDGARNISRKDVTTVINGQRVAKVMLVVTNGKFDFAHLNLVDNHTEWEQNLEFARLLTEKIKQRYPGLLNRLEIRDTTYNQDLHPHSLLLEIGDYRNTTQEAIRSARLVADVLAELLADVD